MSAPGRKLLREMGGSESFAVVARRSFAGPGAAALAAMDEG